MNRLKVFVGIAGRWVLCEKFPDDQEHDGLQEELAELVLEDVEVVEPMGFYMMSFKMDSGNEASCSEFSSKEGVYLDIDKLYPLPKYPVLDNKPPKRVIK